MVVEILTGALVFGFFTGFHCAGMCGPIAIALPLKNTSKLARFTGAFLYNIGRSITYAAMGFLFGMLGEGLNMAGFQQWVSIVMGTLMILSVLFPSLFKDRFELNKTAFNFVGNVKLKLRKLFSDPRHGTLFLIGLLNGLLPCGPVYAAVAAAIATGDAGTGAAFMFLFGIGTMPMLLAISLIGNIISGNLRKKIAKFIPVTVVIIGLLFILRGANLGIPFLSPPMEKMHVPQKSENQDSTKKHSCH